MPNVEYLKPAKTKKFRKKQSQEFQTPSMLTREKDFYNIKNIIQKRHNEE